MGAAVTLPEFSEWTLIIFLDKESNPNYFQL